MYRHSVQLRFVLPKLLSSIYSDFQLFQISEKTCR